MPVPVGARSDDRGDGAADDRRDLGGLDQISWVVTAYLLSSTVSVPLFGKISDLYGRKVMLQITIAIFLLGSVLAGIAQSMPQLIVARGVQGVGGGGIMAMTFTILGDILSPRASGQVRRLLHRRVRQRQRDRAPRRWVLRRPRVLAVGVPHQPAARRHRHGRQPRRYLHIRKTVRPHTIDLLGALLLTLSVTSVLLASSWGGQEYPWGSPQIVGLFVAGVVLAVAFVLQERRAQEPILPLRLFGDRVFTVCITLSALLGSVIIGRVDVPAAVPAGRHRRLGHVVGAVADPDDGGRRARLERVRAARPPHGPLQPYPIIGVAIALLGLVLLSTIEVTTTRLFISVGMGIVGIGIGSSMPIMTIAVQNTAPAADMGAATSSVNFFRTLGGALGVAVFGTVMTARLDDTLQQRLPGTSLATDDSLLSSPEAIRDLPADQYAAVAEGIANGVAMVFLVALPMVVIAFGLAWLLKEIPLHDDLSVQAASVEGLEEAHSSHDGGNRVRPAIWARRRVEEPRAGSVTWASGRHRRQSHLEDTMAKYLLLKRYHGTPAPINDVPMDTGRPRRSTPCCVHERLAARLERAGSFVDGQALSPDGVSVALGRRRSSADADGPFRRDEGLDPPDRS